MTDRNNIRKGEKAMKITKFFTALLLAGVMALTFTACGSDGTNDENTPPTGSSDSTTDSASAETNPQTDASSDSGSGDSGNNSDSSDNGENSGNESGEETKE